MISNQRKTPAKRAFTGLAGSSFATTTPVSPQHKPKDPRQQSVLVHFCFNQEQGASKAERCSCKLRLSMDRAYKLVDGKQADFLLVKNPKTSKLAKFHRAIVIRQTTVAGETLFAVSAPVKQDRRDKTHEQIKAGIRVKARGILHRLFAARTISPAEMQMPDGDIDAILADSSKLTAFLEKISGQKRLQKAWTSLSFMWWSNILGFHRLSANAGQYLVDADRGTGIAVSGGYDTAKVDQVSGAADTEDGRVRVSNHRASFWNGAWDHSEGASPKVDQDDDDYAAEYESATERFEE